MHEMSIVEALLESIRAEVGPYPDARVQVVRVRVGTLRQIEPAMLGFCYDAAVRDTPLAGSRLEVQTVEAAARCGVCSLTFPIEESWFECPRCRSTNAELLTGDELLLAHIEIQNPLPSSRTSSDAPIHSPA
jgi:hydrogenase nickel incorporation protein HypA/HybF